MTWGDQTYDKYSSLKNQCFLCSYPCVAISEQQIGAFEVDKSESFALVLVLPLR